MTYEKTYLKGMHYIISFLIFIGFVGWDVQKANNLDVLASTTDSPVATEGSSAQETVVKIGRAHV